MKKLPKPFYQSGGITIYLGDSAELCPRLPRFDVLLTDPPYGLAEKLVGGTWGKAYEGLQDWDQATPDILPFIELASKSIIWGGNYFQLPPSRNWLIWDKPEKMPTVADCEMAWCSWDGNTKLKRVSRNPDGKRVHPTQKPLALMRWCLRHSGILDNGPLLWQGTVLDPFIGSGTTLVACKLEGVSAVGIEREEKYCRAAVRRLENLDGRVTTRGGTEYRQSAFFKLEDLTKRKPKK